MAERRTLSTWILRLIAIELLSSFVSSDDTNNWSRQLMEMKTMMTLLDAKITAMDSRLSNLNVLEYAFKMNTMDNSMRMLNTRVDQIATQIDSIKESLRNLPASPCTEVAQTQSPQRSRSSSASEDTLVLKLDDYGKKLMQSNQAMKSAAEEHHQSLTAFIEVVRSGFAKVIAKIDSFLTLEGQISAVIPLVRLLSATTDFISEEVTNVATTITEVKTSVSNFAISSKALETQMSIIPPLVRELSDTATLISGDVSNVQTDITEIKRSVSNSTRTSKTLEEFVAEFKNSFAFPVSGLRQALEESEQLQSQMSQLNIIEDKVVKAASLSSRLLAKESMKSLPSEDKEIAQNLTKFLTEIKNVTNPLFLSLPYQFDHIKAIVGDSFATLANKTQCRSDESIKLEIARLGETLSEQNTAEAPRSDDVFAYCRDTIEDLVLEDNRNLKIPLLKLQSHLKILIDVSEKSHRPASETVDREEPLRSLFG